jgi:hypothetical protein
MINSTSDRWNYVVPALLLVALGLAFWAVSERKTFLSAAPLPATTTLDSRSQVVGVTPAEPTPVTATATTAITPADPRAKTDLTKAQQSSAMPMPGQANDHSTLAPNTTLKEAKPKP